VNPVQPLRVKIKKHKHRLAIDRILTFFSVPTLRPPPQGIQVGSDVAAVVIAYAHLRHQSVRLHLPGVLNPVHEIGRCIRQLASNVFASGQAIEGWTDQPMRAGYTVDGVAGIATVFANCIAAKPRISAAGCDIRRMDAGRARTGARRQSAQQATAGIPRLIRPLLVRGESMPPYVCTATAGPSGSTICRTTPEQRWSTMCPRGST
jgi:hypothetical protein